MRDRADDDLQRHQHGIDRNARKGTFASDALFLGGLGDRGGLHTEKRGRSFLLIVPTTNRNRWKSRQKILLNQLLI
ncbi:MAG TPA: hypothetical protein VHU21_12960 [Paraburkholderia sp.]|nr:hypothetical protein [Paraburkholderia sp.]